MQAPFEGSRIKVNRARKFIDELKLCIEQYNKSEPFVVNYTTDGDKWEMELVWKALPPEAGAILGDAVHNLRASLDLMMCELARQVCSDDEKVFFPFADSAARFETVLKNNRVALGKVGPKALELVKSAAPYKGGNELLYGLHKLDVRDKHTAALQTNRILRTRIQINQPNPQNLQAVNAYVVNPRIDHYFSSDSQFRDLPLFGILHALCMAVEHVLNTFAPLAAPKR